MPNTPNEAVVVPVALLILQASFLIDGQREARPALAAVRAGHRHAHVGAQLPGEQEAEVLRVWGRMTVMKYIYIYIYFFFEGLYF